MRVAVLGSSTCVPGSEMWEAASELGRGISEREHVLLTGGAAGVSAAAGHAAKHAGGIVVGILPAEISVQETPLLDQTCLTIPIFTLGPPKIRNVILLSSCEIAIAIGGGYGTLNEMTIAIAQNVPLVVVEGYGGAADMIRNIVHGLGQASNVVFVKDVPGALAQIKQTIRKGEEANETTEPSIC